MLLNRSIKKLVFSFFLFIAPVTALASACCGGGFAMPALITGDDHATVTTSYSYSKVDSDVTDAGVWIKRNNDDLTSKVFKIDGAFVFDDRYQAGLSVPIQTRSKQGGFSEDSTGLGDVSALAGYEYLPDWDYNPWRPHGVGFLTLTLPTGKSIQETQTVSGIDGRGRGFWALGVGTTLTKAWTVWDGNSTFEVHRSFDKTVHNAQIDGTIKPGYGGSFVMGAGYNIKGLRLGTTLSWNYEDAINVVGNNSSDGSVERFATGTVSASYMFKESWAATASYSDQTLFGDPTRTTLSKIVAVSLQKRWTR
ncbi:MAG: serine protease spb1 [Bdellovibrio sp.]|nr:serine protease spb1 [Bdellovibrio sp.]